MVRYVHVHTPCLAKFMTIIEKNVLQKGMGRWGRDSHRFQERR